MRSVSGQGPKAFSAMIRLGGYPGRVFAWRTSFSWFCRATAQMFETFLGTNILILTVILIVLNKRGRLQHFQTLETDKIPATENVILGQNHGIPDFPDFTETSTAHTQYCAG